MNDGFDAGSIVVSLKAQLNSFLDGMAVAKEALNELADVAPDLTVAFQEIDTATVVFQEIETGAVQAGEAFANLGLQAEAVGTAVAESATRMQAAGTSGASGFDAMTSGSNRSEAQFARMISKLIALDLGIHAFSSSAQNSFGALGTKIQAGEAGLMAFASVAMVIPGPVGLALGAIAALVAVMDKLSGTSKDAIDQMKALVTAAQSFEKIGEDAQKARGLLDSTAGMFGKSASDYNKEQLSIAEKEITDYLKFLQDANKKKDELGSQLADLEEKGANESAIKALKDQITALENQIKTAQGQLDHLTHGGPVLGAPGQNPIVMPSVQVLKARTEIDDVNEGLTNLQKKIQTSNDIAAAEFKAGLITPMDVAKTKMDGYKQLMEETIKDIAKLQDDLGKTNGDDNAIKELQSQIAAKQLYLTTLQDQLRQAVNDEKTQQAIQQFSTQFGDTIGNAVTNGIVSGQKGFQILANIGQGLFSDMMKKVTQDFTKELTSAMSSLAGATGLGSVLTTSLTAGLGIAGLFLSKLGNNASQTQSAIQSAVTSTQAVQGIVAGPTSIAIAQVASDLTTAVAPVVTALAAVNGWLQKIETNTRGGSGSGFSSNVAVATR